MKKFYFWGIILLAGIISFSGCKHKEKKSPAGNLEEQDTVENLVKVFYLVPSPDDIFGFAEDETLHFNKSLLNPVANMSKYNDTKTQELNFGIYSADLAYAAAFGKKQEVKDYLQAVKNLSDKISLSAVFNESLVHRIDNLGTNKDSLIAISNDTYFDIIRYLEKTNRINTLSIMAAGGWLETMYIVINLIDYDKDKATVQKVADQKIIFTNLYRLLEQNLDDKNVKSVYEDLKPLKNLYDQLEITHKNDIDEHSVTIDDNKIIVGGDIEIIITKEQFSQLRDVINTIRKKFTLN
jgi:hypothetical protein